MTTLNIAFTEEEMKDLIEKKLAEAKRQGSELTWHDFILLASNKVSR